MVLNLKSQNLNDSCLKSLQICSGYTYTYPLNTNTTAQSVPNYGCLNTQPNPAWYFLKVAVGGNFIFNIVSPTGNDVDFACWGPFLDPNTPCVADLTAACTQCPNNTVNPAFYPSGNLVDCSFDPAYTETLHIYNAQPNEYYIIVITNYSNQPGTVHFYQTNAGQPGAGIAECNNIANISGKVYLDVNTNNIYDSTDIPLPYAMIESPKCGSFYFMTDDYGHYDGYVCYTPDTIKAYYPYIPYIQSINPPSYTVDSNLSNADFAIILEPGICDAGVYVVQYTPVTMWSNSIFDIILDNWGTSDLYLNLTITLDSNFSYVDTTIPPSSINGNTLVWDSLFIPFLTYDIFSLTVAVNDTTLTTNTPYVMYASTYPINCTSDADTSNNFYVIDGIIGTSYDPNYKEVTPAGEISASQAANQQEFIYTIHFQNTGTAPAHNITIVDTLSNWLNMTSLALIGSSHPCTYQINEHSIVSFNFNNINLPDSATDEAGSHGYVMFKVKCLPSLANGGNVYNRAHIFFDANPPVTTNTVLTYVRNATYISPNIKPSVNELNITPNPVNNVFTVSSPYNIEKIEIYSSNSKLVKSIILNKQVKEITLSKDQLPSGFYMVKVTTVKGNILKSKIIIE